MLVSMTVTPVMSSYLLPKMRRIDHGDSTLVTHLKRWDEALLSWSFPRTKILLCAAALAVAGAAASVPFFPRAFLDRKSTRLNSSHLVISYAVFCLKKNIVRIRD